MGCKPLRQWVEESSYARDEPHSRRKTTRKTGLPKATHPTSILCWIHSEVLIRGNATLRGVHSDGGLVGGGRPEKHDIQKRNKAATIDNLFVKHREHTESLDGVRRVQLPVALEQEHVTLSKIPHDIVSLTILRGSSETSLQETRSSGPYRYTNEYMCIWMCASVSPTVSQCHPPRMLGLPVGVFTGKKLVRGD